MPQLDLKIFHHITTIVEAYLILLLILIFCLFIAALLEMLLGFLLNIRNTQTLLYDDDWEWWFHWYGPNGETLNFEEWVMAWKNFYEKNPHFEEKEDDYEFENEDSDNEDSDKTPSSSDSNKTATSEDWMTYKKYHEKNPPSSLDIDTFYIFYASIDNNTNKNNKNSAGYNWRIVWYDTRALNLTIKNIKKDNK